VNGTPAIEPGPAPVASAGMVSDVLAGAKGRGLRPLHEVSRLGLPHDRHLLDCPR
jgi:hypothetical protein